MKFRTFLLGISALLIASCAAYFSVLGLSKLFAGASAAVIVMGAALEFGKLITAGYLYNYWTKINKILRFYLFLATIVLVLITSAGIYGFLTSAYQTTADQLAVMDRQIEITNLKKDRYQTELTDYQVEREQLNKTIGDLSKGLANNVIQYTDSTGRLITTTSSATRRVLTEQLNDMKGQRDKITSKMDVLNDSITALDLRALDIQTSNEVAAEVGPLKYLAEITGQPMNKVVNWFALFLIFVFDPLAVMLVVSFNNAMRVDRGIVDKEKAEKKRTVYGEYEEEEWDGFGKYPKTDEEVDDLNDAKRHAEVVEEMWETMEDNSYPLSNDDFARLLDDEYPEPNEELQRAAKDYSDVKNNPPLDLDNDDEDAETLPPLTDEERIDASSATSEGKLRMKDDIHLSPSARDEIMKMVDEDEWNKKHLEYLKYKDENYIPDDVDINDIELVEEEYILYPDENDLPHIPEDLNQDGVVTPEEQKEAKNIKEDYESGDWKKPWNGKPFYHHPWFDWHKTERWINDAHAVEFWKQYRGGSQSQYDFLIGNRGNNQYPTDFSSKTY